MFAGFMAGPFLPCAGLSLELDRDDGGLVARETTEIGKAMLERVHCEICGTLKASEGKAPGNVRGKDWPTEMQPEGLRGLSTSAPL